MKNFDEDQHWQMYCVEGQQHPGVSVNGDFNEGDGASFLARLQPNAHTLPHIHNGEEVLTILNGEVEVRVNGQVETVQKGQSKKIIAGHIHTVRNRTSEVVYVQVAFFPGFKIQKTTILNSDAES